MDKKIAELTEKLYLEGVQKGEAQKQALMEAAEKEAAAIRSEARKEAEKIIADARAASDEFRRTAESEIRLAGTQAVSAVKQRILELVTMKAIDGNVSATLSDPAVIRDLVVTMLKSWKDTSGVNTSLEIILPENRRNELEKEFENTVKGILKEPVSISFSRTVKGGFQIVPAGGTFRISMTDEDFITFFKEFLRPKARKFLFGE